MPGYRSYLTAFYVAPDTPFHEDDEEKDEPFARYIQYDHDR